MTEDAASYHDAPPRSPVALRVLPSRGFSSEPAARAMTLRVQGRLRGASLDALGGVLEQAMAAPQRVVRLDVSAVDDWSTLAQAMVLHTARALELRDARLVLVGAGPELRDQSHWLDVFARVDSVP